MSVLGLHQLFTPHRYWGNFLWVMQGPQAADLLSSFATSKRGSSLTCCVNYLGDAYLHGLQSKAGGLSHLMHQIFRCLKIRVGFSWCQMSVRRQPQTTSLSFLLKWLFKCQALAFCGLNRKSEMLDEIGYSHQIMFSFSSC